MARLYLADPRAWAVEMIRYALDGMFGRVPRFPRFGFYHRKGEIEGDRR